MFKVFVHKIWLPLINWKQPFSTFFRPFPPKKKKNNNKNKVTCKLTLRVRKKCLNPRKWLPLSGILSDLRIEPSFILLYPKVNLYHTARNSRKRKTFENTLIRNQGYPQIALSAEGGGFYAKITIHQKMEQFLQKSFNEERGRGR